MSQTGWVPVEDDKTKAWKPVEETPPPAQEGMLSRIVRGAGRGLSNIVGGMADAGTIVNPVAGMLTNPQHTLETMQGLGESHINQAREIGKSYNDPYLKGSPILRGMSVVGNTLGTILPGVGPWAANMGRKIGQSAAEPQGDLAGNISEAATTIGAPELARIPVIRRLPGAARDTIGEAIHTREGKISPVIPTAPAVLGQSVPSLLDRAFPEPEAIKTGRMMAQARRIDPFETRRAQTAQGLQPVGRSSQFSIEGPKPIGRDVILPGEEVDPMKTRSAGSAAQATEQDLQRLATAGDRSAARELVRRRIPQGGQRIDYSKIPLPRF